MTLPANGFTLLQINTELATSGLSLSACVATAEKTGIWNDMLDFANFTKQTGFVVSPLSVWSPLGGLVGYVATITCATTWTISKDQTWITISKTSGTGSTTFTITVAGGAEASGYVTVVSAGVSKYIYIYRSLYEI